MSHSLNPKATEAPAATPPNPPAGAGHPVDTGRRDVTAGVMAVILGTLAGVIPVLIGIPVAIFPVLKKWGKGKPAGGESKHPSIRVATLESLPADGRPIAVPVISDKVDAWTREANQPVGAVFLRRVENNKVECFNAICPHAGCMVAFSGERGVFQCPCHTSSFTTDGKRIMPSPSPRDMDRLAVDEAKLKEGEVWVEFVNYYPGKEHQEAK